ncbi:MAG: GAF domain-containing protein, partial [Planctomycetota bacterium]
MQERTSDAASPRELARRLGAEQLFPVLDAVRQASGPLDPHTLLHLVADTIRRGDRLLSHVSIFAWGPDRGRIRAMAVAGEARRRAPGWVEPDPDGALGRVLASGVAHVSNDLRCGPGAPVGLAPRSRSLLCLPIRAGDEVLGVLNIESHRPGVFEAPQRALFEIVCERLASYLQGIGLRGEARGGDLKIQRVTQICRHVLGATSLQEALQVAVRRVVDECGYDGACVVLLGEDGTRLQHRAHHARDRLRLPGGRGQEIPRGLVGMAARQR